MHYKVSTIVPIFNVRNYLARCVECLMKQTLREIEYIFVDDCSPDDSFDVLMETLSMFPERQKDVKIIRHETNKGLAMSRADGLDVATGDFIIHCDSDDWMDVTMYEKMYDKAIADGADICICDFYFARKEGLERMHPRIDCTKPHEKVVQDFIVCEWNPVWNLLVSRDVYQRSGARPPVGITFTEDFYLTIRLFEYALKVTDVKEPLYYYNQQNNSSIVHSMDLNVRAQEGDCYDRTINWFKEKGVYEKYYKQMQWRLLKADHYLVSHNKFEEFRKAHPESHRYILTVPFPVFTLKQKLILLLTIWKFDSLCRWDNERHGRYD